MPISLLSFLFLSEAPLLSPPFPPSFRSKAAQNPLRARTQNQWRLRPPFRGQAKSIKRSNGCHKQFIRERKRYKIRKRRRSPDVSFLAFHFLSFVPSPKFLFNFDNMS